MKITENGIYTLNSGFSVGTTVVSVSGVFGTAVLAIGYFDEYENFILFTDGAVTGPDTQYVVEHGLGIKPVLEVTGADGSTAISVVITGIK